MEAKPFEVMITTEVIEAEAYERVLDKITQIIEDNQGKVDAIDRWGKKGLPCDVEGKKEGIYVLYQFTGIAETVRELDRILKIEEKVLRYLIIRK